MRILLEENRVQGFFSCFNLVLCAITILHNSGYEDIYVNWTNPLYQSNPYNMFDKYLWNQKLDNQKFDRVYSCYDVMYNHKLKKFFDAKKQKNLTIYDILYNNNFFQNQIFKDCKSKAVKTENCLGVHVRKTDTVYHRLKNEMLNNQYYFSKIEENLNSYSSLFLCTDDANVLNDFKKRYGNRLIYNNNIFRVTGNIAIHNSNYNNKEKLVEDVIIDTMSLSECAKILITQSNLSNFILELKRGISHQYLDLNVEYGLI